MPIFRIADLVRTQHSIIAIQDWSTGRAAPAFHLIDQRSWQAKLKHIGKLAEYPDACGLPSII